MTDDSVGGGRTSQTTAESARDDGIDRSESVLGVYVRGLAMGAADAVPGVSGGTIALLTGIYDRLVAAIAAVDLALVRQFLAGVVRADTDALRDALDRADATFLVALLAGIGTALAAVVPVLELGVERAPAATFGFFFGLIAASVAVLREWFDLSSRRGRVATAAGVLLAFVVSGVGAELFGASLAATVIAGALTLSATLLPGLSGSLILVVIGQYDRIVTGVIPDFFRAVPAAAARGSLTPLREPGVTLAAFLLGGVLGVVTVANVVRRALARDRATTMTFLVGLVVGALRAPVAETTRQLADLGRVWTPETVALFVGSAVVGVVAVVGLDRAGPDIDL
ncbi:MAG: DUF368 domain-containing protein [Halobaculum sp.]